MLRTATDEPQHPVDAHDHELAEVTDKDVMDQLTPADIKVYGAHATASAKPKPSPKKAKAKPAAACASGSRSSG